MGHTFYNRSGEDHARASISLCSPIDVLCSKRLRQLVQTYFIRTMHMIITQRDQKAVMCKHNKPKIKITFLFWNLLDVLYELTRKFQTPTTISCEHSHTITTKTKIQAFTNQLTIPRYFWGNGGVYISSSLLLNLN